MLLRKLLLREHSSNLFLGQNDVLHRILLAFEVLRVVVHVGREEELFYKRQRNSSSSKRTIREAWNIPWFQSKPCPRLTQLTNLGVPPCPRSTTVCSDLLSELPVVTQAQVSIPVCRIRRLTGDMATTARKQLCVPNKLARLGWTTSFSLPLPFPKLAGLALKDEGE